MGSWKVRLGLCFASLPSHQAFLRRDSMPEHPESFPVNALVPIEGTPLEKNPVRTKFYVQDNSQHKFINCRPPFKPLPHHTILRTIATARIVLPTSIIRLAAGRQTYSESEQALCFMAGANAIFTGDAMLTTPCSFFLLCLITPATMLF